jgi:hypothetical protein
MLREILVALVFLPGLWCAAAAAGDTTTWSPPPPTVAETRLDHELTSAIDASIDLIGDLDLVGEQDDFQLLLNVNYTF